MAALCRPLACALLSSAPHSLTLAGPLTAVLSDPANIKVKLEPIATLSGLVPIDSATIPGDGHLYVGTYIASTAGVQIVDPTTKTVSPTPFMTFAGSGVPISGQGLQGITFSPNFHDNTQPGYRKFYTYEAETGPGGANVMFLHPEVANPGTVGVIREWTANAAGTAIDTTIPSRVVLNFGTPGGHMGGGIKFGPDGYLYLATGDGGGNGNGGSTNNNTDGFTGRNPAGTSTDVPGISNGADFTNLLGKVIRIDPYTTNADGSPRDAPVGATARTFGGATRYFIPGDNPFVGNPQNIYFTPIGPVGSQTPVAPLGELFAFGFRNPWKLSFDKNALLGAAPYVADVGSRDREEIVLLQAGKNYGWPYREGEVATGAASGRPLVNDNLPYLKQTSPGVYAPFDSDPTLSDPAKMALPLAMLGTRSGTGSPLRFYDRPDADAFSDGTYGDEYGDGDAVVGGFVYRGSAIPALQGMYVLGAYEYLVIDPNRDPDTYPATSGGGRLFYLDPNEAATYKTVREFNFAPGAAIPANAAGNLLSISQGDDGELYAMFAGGDILRIAAPPLPGDYNSDHMVDAADYTVWRDHVGSTDELPNDEIGGEIGEAHYQQWKANFGSGGGAFGFASVPEPATLYLVVIALACCERIRIRGGLGAKLLAIVVGLCSQNDSIAASYFWDTNGASFGIGSAGGATANWLSNSWATDSAGNLATGPWPNTQGANSDEAVFQGTAGTVSIAADVFVNELRFQTNNYVINSTGGMLHLVGADPKITVNLASSNQVVTISAPLVGDNGLTLAGNSLSGGLKFLVLANANLTTPNSFAGPLTIDAGGALRLGGGVAAEQIPDEVDMQIAGAIDFVTSGGASDGKQERVRNVAVSGANAIFSVGNGSNFIVNSMAGSGTQNISVNGNTASAPGKLSITGWADGAGNLTLTDSAARVNTTSNSFAIGGRILLAGNLLSSGTSAVINHNGGPTTPEDHVFTNKALDFTSAAHTIDVTSGTLTFTSRAAIQPLDITSTFPGGTTLTKTGSGVLLYEHAVQSSFTGSNRIAAGTLRLGANERLANESTLEVAGGVFDMQGFVERVGIAILDGGSIVGSAPARLIGTQFDVRSGSIGVQLDGLASLTKSTDGLVELISANTYSGDTSITAGTLRLLAPSLADAADVHLTAGSTLELSFSGIDVVDSLFVDGVSQATGTWGSPTSTADHKSPLFSGDGFLQVTTFIAPLLLAGDFNNDGTVDAADYTAWRDALGSATTLPNDQTPGMVTAEDYDDWKSNFGAAGGSGSAQLAAAALPELNNGASALVALSLCVGANRDRKFRTSLGFSSENLELG